MPLLKEKEIKEVEVTKGFKCDSCEKYHLIKLSDMHSPIIIDHTFGYYSNHDLVRIRATICKDCYYKIMKNNVKNLQIGDNLC